MKLLDNDKINFVVGEHHKFSSKRPRGGHIVLHLLAKKLAERGENVYMFAEPMYPHKNIHAIPQEYIEDEHDDSNVARWTYESFTYPIGKTVSIYSSEVIGNPYGTYHNARWILDHIDTETESTWGSEDEYFDNVSNFSSHSSYSYKRTRFLNVIDYHFDDLYDEKKPRKGFCFIPWKYTPDNYEDLLKVFNPFISYNWVNDGGYTFLREMFNNHEYFLTFDTKTFLTQAAAMCGCKAIILKSPESPEYTRNLSPTQYRLENAGQMFGVAYGMEDIAWANETIHLSREHLKELEKIDNRSVDDFIDYWRKRLNAYT